MNMNSRISPLGLVAVVFAITISPGSVLLAQATDSVPTVNQILDRYIQALGGKANLEKVTSRVAKGECENADWETKGPYEVYTKAPDKFLSVTNFTDYGIIQRGFNGKVGWVQDPNSGLEEINGGALLQMKREADFYHDLKLRQQYPAMKLLGRQKVGDQDAYEIEAIPSEGLSGKLYFDVATGLLIRSDSQNELPDGRMTVITLYEDYRDVDGIKVPFSIYQSNLESGITIKLSEVKHNVLIDDAKFEKPAK